MTEHEHPKAPQHFVDATLGALRLDPCAHAEEQAAAYLAAALPALEQQLLAAHLATCARCTALLDVLAALERQLPALAHRPVPAGFTQRVLAATSAQPRRTATPSLLQTLLQRPRFAAEAAYCCTLLLALTLGLPTADGGQLLRGFGPGDTRLVAQSGELLAQGSALGKEHLQRARTQLQSLYAESSSKVRDTLNKFAAAEPFR